MQLENPVGSSRFSVAEPGGSDFRNDVDLIAPIGYEPGTVSAHLHRHGADATTRPVPRARRSKRSC